MARPLAIGDRGAPWNSQVWWKSGRRSMLGRSRKRKPGAADEGSIVQANPLVTLEEIPDTGIFVMEDQPKRLDELIAAFAAELAGRRQSKH